MRYDKFSAEQQNLDAQEKKYDAINADTALVSVSNLAADWSKINADTTSVARNQQFLKNLKKDIYLFEAAQVVNEMNLLLSFEYRQIPKMKIQS